MQMRPILPPPVGRAPFAVARCLSWGSVALTLSVFGCSTAAPEASVNGASAQLDDARFVALPALGQVPGCDVCGQMAVIPAGSFTMGSAPEEPGRNAHEGPQHVVQIAAFEIGRTEVTQAQWEAVMSDVTLESTETGLWQRAKAFVRRLRTNNNPSGFRSCGPACPVERMSWNDAQLFIEHLNKQTGRTYRLPTEAEWEYAARAGTAGNFAWGEQITPAQANYNGTIAYNGGALGEYRQITVRADAFAANAFGLYNVSGNVWEWTVDCWNPGYQNAPNDGSAWLSGDCSQHVMRGGSWIDNPAKLRSASRNKDIPGPSIRDSYAGFRLARSLP
jgi:formylglycine-generating enzyme required for sulfatase activity